MSIDISFSFWLSSLSVPASIIAYLSFLKNMRSLNYSMISDLSSDGPTKLSSVGRNIRPLKAPKTMMNRYILK